MSPDLIQKSCICITLSINSCHLISLFRNIQYLTRIFFWCLIDWNELWIWSEIYSENTKSTHQSSSICHWCVKCKPKWRVDLTCAEKVLSSIEAHESVFYSRSEHRKGRFLKGLLLFNGSLHPLTSFWLQSVCNSLQAKLYLSIIDDVIESMRELYLDEGLEDRVLDDLRRVSKL